MANVLCYTQGYHKETFAERNLKIEVIDALGREIYKQNVQATACEGGFEIPTTVLGNGLNIVHVYADNKLLKVTKLMKE